MFDSNFSAFSIIVFNIVCVILAVTFVCKLPTRMESEDIWIQKSTQQLHVPCTVSEVPWDFDYRWRGNIFLRFL